MPAMSSATDPTTKVQLDRLLYTHYQHTNLQSAHKFFMDFGLHVAQKTATAIYYRGFGDNPYVYIAEQSPDKVKHFMGGGWLAESLQDLDRASRLPGASGIQDSDAPGGGKYVEIKDPNGVLIKVHHGISMRALGNQNGDVPKPVTFNSWEDKPRKGEFQRFDGGPSKIHKLGHYGLVVDKARFEETVEWYLSTFSLAVTDCIYDKDSNKDTMTFIHIDKGEDFTDHHSFFVQSPPTPVRQSYAHHSSFEVDNMDTQLLGHFYLQKEGWTNCWGIGRHILGSQIFDYWFDPSGNIVEHYSDGDLVNNKTAVDRQVAAPDTMAIWGPNVTLAFLTTRMEDIAMGSNLSALQQGPVTV